MASNNWLDEILDNSVRTWKAQGRSTDEKWAVNNYRTGTMISAKQYILSHIEEAIGEDEEKPEIPQNDYYWRFRNQLRAEIREKLL